MRVGEAEEYELRKLIKSSKIYFEEENLLNIKYISTIDLSAFLFQFESNPK